MGITPITILTPLSLARTVESDLELMPMARVENSARTGEETYSPSEQQAAPSPDDSAEEDSAEEEFEDLLNEANAEPNREPAATPENRRISFLA